MKREKSGKEAIGESPPFLFSYGRKMNMILVEERANGYDGCAFDGASQHLMVVHFTETRKKECEKKIKALMPIFHQGVALLFRMHIGGFHCCLEFSYLDHPYALLT